MFFIYFHKISKNINLSKKKVTCLSTSSLRIKNVGINLGRAGFINILKKTTKQIMRKKPKTINQEMFAADALEIMEKNKITQLFVVKNNTPIGILHIHDCVELGLI